MKSLIPDWLPKLFVKSEGSVREATTKKFSDFNKITDTEGMEVVGIKGGVNVRTDFPVAGEAGEVTTSMVELEPDDPLRNTRGQFMPTKELPELSNQKDANRFIASELQRLDQEIEGIESGGGEVDLSDYATIEYVDETELNVLNAAIKVAQDGDKVLQDQIDALEEPDFTGYATEEYVDEAILNIDFPDPDLSDYATIEYVDQTELDVLNAALKVSAEGDAKLQEQIDAIPETDLTGYVTEDQLTQVDEASEFRDDALNQKIDDESQKNTVAHLKLEDQIQWTNTHYQQGDQKLQDQIDAIETDLTEYAKTEYVDEGDRRLQAEIEQIALGLETLLTQRTHGQWKYIGFSGDNIPRNAGEFALASDDLSSSENIMTINLTDLNGTTVGLGDVEVGDYIEIVDLDEPDNYALFTCTKEPEGTGISNIELALKDKGQNFLVGETCEIRFFAVNEENINLSELDDRYVKQTSSWDMGLSTTLGVNQLKPLDDGRPFVYYEPTDYDNTHPCGIVNRGMMQNYVEDLYVNVTGDTMTGTLTAPKLESKTENGPAAMLIEGYKGNTDVAARLTMSNRWNANAYGSLTFHGLGAGAWFQFNKDLDLSSNSLHSVSHLRFSGDKAIQDGTNNRILLNNKVTIPKAGDSNIDGFTIKGKTEDGNNTDLLSVYHNTSGHDAINYKGKQDAPTNLATVGYVSDAIAADGGQSELPEWELAHFTFDDLQAGKMAFCDGDLKGTNNLENARGIVFSATDANGNRVGRTKDGVDWQRDFGGALNVLYDEEKTMLTMARSHGSAPAIIYYVAEVDAYMIIWPAEKDAAVTSNITHVVLDQKYKIHCPEIFF